MSGYPNPGSGGGGSVGTLAQVLAKGADANGVEITDAHDPTAAQSVATKAYVDATAGGAPIASVFSRTGAVVAVQDDYPAYLIDSYGVRPVFNVQSFGAIGNGSTDDTTALQNALNAAHAVNGGQVYIPGNFTCKFTTQLTIYSGTTLIGDALQGQSGVSQLYWYGADATHAVIAASGASKVGVSGIRLEDHRTTPTSGDGFHLTVTNGTLLDNVSSYSFPSSCIYYGQTSGAVDNVTIRHVWVQSLGGYGITLDHSCENILLQDIKGSATGTGLGMKALIHLLGSASTGLTNVVIIGAKLEAVPSSPSPVPDLSYIDSTFHGMETLIGGYVAAHGGFLVNNQSINTAFNVISASTVGPTSGLIYTSAAGTLVDSFGNITTPGTASTLGNGTSVLNAANVRFVASGYTSNTL